ncbi:flagellar biosynthetic protein FliO [Halomonas sp. C22]|uniref:Flagellar protein n=1 Tax=Vreelandella hamiltonii TaxID=502829 RepID=A0A8H9I5E1_9GAMM|nr:MULTISPECIES: flagellar biosynthetic protein FliO [Halomonas]KHJ50701.1 mopB [Halomonas hydrothermalis]GGW21632.1 hypothetical protein GCM10007157_09090 [Halomonas hamiltonii]
MSVATTSTSVDALSGGDALIGMAVLGKTAAALALVVAIILVCTALLKRWQQHRYDHGAHLRVVGSTAIGSRERVVVVEIEDTWLVLAVSGGKVSMLHERPAPEDRAAPIAESSPSPFSQRFSSALANHRLKRSGAQHTTDSQPKP